MLQSDRMESSDDRPTCVKISAPQGRRTSLLHYRLSQDRDTSRGSIGGSEFSFDYSLHLYGTSRMAAPTFAPRGC